MPTGKPIPPEPDRRSAERLSTRELMARTVVRIRADLARLEQYAEVIGINTPTPAEVEEALEILDTWTRELVRGARRHKP